MTDHRLESEECLDPETLAAYVENRLDGSERARVEHHIASCRECYEVFLETTTLIGEVPNAAAAPSPHASRVRWWIAAAAAAAVVFLAVALRPFLLPAGNPVDRGLQDLVAAVGTGRFVEARLTPSFAWGPAPSPARGVESPRQTSLEVQQAALTLRSLAQRDATPQALHAAAIGLLATGDVDMAIDTFDRAAALDAGNAAIHADLSAALLERWRRTAAPVDAARALDEAERARLERPDLPAALFNRALALEALGMRAEARNAWQAYLASDPASGWSTEARERLAALAGTAAVSPADVAAGISDAALETLARDDAIVLYRALERHLLPRWAAGQDGAAAMAAATRVADALDAAGRDRYWVDMVRLAERLPAGGAQRQALADAIRMLDQWWDVYDQGLYDRARQGAEAARRALIAAGAPSAEAEQRLALVDVISGHTADGLTRLASAERTWEPGAYYRAITMAAQLRGIAAVQRLSLDEAIASYQRALVFAERGGDREARAVLNAYLSTAYLAQGNRAAAWAAVAASARDLDAVDNARRGYQFYARTSTVAQGAGFMAAAVGVIGALLADPVEKPHPWAHVGAYVSRARALAALQKPDAARDDLEAARSLSDRIVDTRYRREAQSEVAITTGELLAASDSTRAAHALTEGLAFEEVRRNQFRTASLLLTRGRAYANSGDVTHAEADWAAGVQLLEDTRLSVRDAQLRVARTSDSWDLFEELIDVRRDRPALALQTIERAHARELLDSLAPDDSAAAQPLNDDFSWLPADTTALVYSVGRTRLLIWTVSARGLSLHEHVVPASTLAREVDAAVRAIREGRSPDRSLSARLLPPALDLAGMRSLVVVPDGVLHQLPFSLLQDPRSGTLLLDSLFVTVAPSLTILKQLESLPRASRPSAPLLVGAGQANPQEQLPALPGVNEELDALRRIYNGATVLTGTGATPDAVLRALPRTDLLHFAGHAVSDAVLPSQSRLLLGGGEVAAVLKPAEIAASHIRSGALVVLAACGTAAGQSFRGEGPLNLARPFLVAGAATVLGTLWPVADRDASRMLVEFHALVAKGVRPGEALALMQRKAPGVAQANWAAFVVIGRG